MHLTYIGNVSRSNLHVAANLLVRRRAHETKRLDVPPRCLRWQSPRHDGGGLQCVIISGEWRRQDRGE